MKSILIETIHLMDCLELNVREVVCDQSSNNRVAHRLIDVLMDHPYIEYDKKKNSINGEKLSLACGIALII